jgi:cytidyltransferase-like protein
MKVFVSGCYDMLHSGHVAFFEEAATHGDLYVGLGSDKTINQLKARKTINTDKNLLQFGKYFRESFEAQIAMFPNMVTPQITEAIHQYESSALGWKISGAGGGGYLVLVSETPVGNAMQIRIRR